jgi:carboxyl-terminal processing protease
LWVSAALLLTGPAPAKTPSLSDVLENASPEVQPKEIYGQITRIVAEGLPVTHINHEELSDEVAVEALEIYLDQLDYDRTYFMQPDIASFREKACELDDAFREGSLQFAYDVFNLYRERVRDRVQHVDRLLEKGFDLDADESYLWQRKDAPRAGNREAWDALWRKKVKNEYIAFVVNKKLAEERQAEDPDYKAANESDEDMEELKLTPEERIRKRYRQLLSVVDGHDAEFVLQTYLNAFTQAYDAHTSYFSPRANEDFDINMKLSLTGIGAVLNVKDGAARIVRLVTGGPAERDGRLKPGDKIIAVAQGPDEKPVDILYWPLYRSVRLIRGEPGTTVVLTVIPASDVSGTKLSKVDLVRETIKLEDQAARLDTREMSTDQGRESVKIGVITLPEFYADIRGIRNGEEDSRSSSRDVKRLVTEAKEKGVDGLILDLRNNSGGALSEAIEMTGFFIKQGPVVQVKGSRSLNVLHDPDSGILYDGPLVVLVNRMSASASEILAGALQDHGRALVIGDTKTHGKGTVQSVFPLDRYNAKLGSLKVTTAGFYRVNGQSTQLKGVEPDIVLRSAFDVMDVGEEFLPNVLQESWVNATQYTPDATLKGKVEALRKRSEARRASDEPYRAYEALVDRLAERTRMKYIPLKLDDRLELARQDRELNELQEKLSEELSGLAGKSSGEENDDNASASDVILRETLYILRDLIRINGSHDDVELISGTSLPRRPSPRI